MHSITMQQLNNPLAVNSPLKQNQMFGAVKPETRKKWYTATVVYDDKVQQNTICSDLYCQCLQLLVISWKTNTRKSYLTNYKLYKTDCLMEYICIC